MFLRLMLCCLSLLCLCVSSLPLVFSFVVVFLRSHSDASFVNGYGCVAWRFGCFISCCFLLIGLRRLLLCCLLRLIRFPIFVLFVFLFCVFFFVVAFFFVFSFFVLLCVVFFFFFFLIFFLLCFVLFVVFFELFVFCRLLLPQLRRH